MNPRVDVVGFLEWRHRVIVTVFILYKDMSLINKTLDVSRKICCRIDDWSKRVHLDYRSRQ